MLLGKNIARLRKSRGWTQAELGEKLGVSNQAVSKWESGMNMPDVMLLPALADVFECHIDELYSREVKTELHYDLCAELPWADDETVRIFKTRGKKILSAEEDNACIEVVFPRECNETTRQYFKVEVFGNLITSSSINGDVVCRGNVSGSEINGDITADGDVSACSINSCGKISCRQVKPREKHIMMPYEICPMTTDAEKDEKAYVHWKTWQETYTGLMPQDFLASQTLEKCIKIAHARPQNTLLLKVDGKVVGFSCIDQSAAEGATELQALYLLQEYHSQKLGYELLKATLSAMPPATPVVLWVLKGNDRAIRFYEKFGFRHTGRQMSLPFGTQLQMEMK